MQRYFIWSITIMIAGTLFSGRIEAQIETLVMPGPVIEGHADVEGECKSCHQPFQRQNQRALCLDCHEDVANDISSSAGYHGLAGNAKEARCATCHTDHEGRDANIVILNTATFDHKLTDFPLLGGHATTACVDCHVEDEKFRDAPSNCFSCHEDDNVHGKTMGEVCEDCHNTIAWDDVTFDHDTTDFPLIGKHNDATCLDCHEDDTFPPPPTNCYGCHAEDDSHNGKSGNQCENCHNPTGWDDTSFDHSRDTDFDLIGKHADLSCNDCHSDDPFGDVMDMDCVGCHLEDDNHEGHFGAKCDTCHTPDDWALVVFDHDVDTNHPLNGAHEQAECTACHIEPIFDVPLAGDACNDCHAEDDSHDGTLGIVCNDCHNEVAWEDKLFFDHDLTSFPLLGHHVEQECAACHETHRFSDAPTECVSCHTDDDPHRGNFHQECSACHTPVEWQLWQFDHDLQTEFPLDGAHAIVACEGCHRMPLDKIKSIDSSCGNCHRADDIHDGEFGLDCGRCHSADSFREVRSLQ
ncbi:MAG: hypothetical protein WBN23_11080 [Woeseia sp.]